MRSGPQIACLWTESPIRATYTKAVLFHGRSGRAEPSMAGSTRTIASDKSMCTAPSKKKDEIGWTCDFQVLLISRRWLEEIKDLIDPSKTFVGRVFQNGQE